MLKEKQQRQDKLITDLFSVLSEEDCHKLIEITKLEAEINIEILSNKYGV